VISAISNWAIARDAGRTTARIDAVPVRKNRKI
jgi:hypothetical protein